MVGKFLRVTFLRGPGGVADALGVVLQLMVGGVV